MQTSAHTSSHAPSNATFTVFSSFNMDSGGEDTTEEKGKVSLMMKRNTESIEIEKQLKKEIARGLLRAGEEMLFINSKVN